MTPQIVQDALWLIHNKYVVEPDFRKSAKMGLERSRLLAESDALAETWPALKNTDNRGQYLHRLNRLIKKIDRLLMTVSGTQEACVCPADAGCVLTGLIVSLCQFLQDAFGFIRCVVGQ